jgi:hypothetical protein
MQELGLKLVDYDKDYSATASFGSNHTFIAQIDAPDGYGFDRIFRVLPEPNFMLEDAGRRHVRLRIGTDSNFNTFLWDSDTTLEPQRTGTSFTAGSANTLYAAFELNFVTSTGGSLSPFEVGTTPYVKGLGLSYTLREL